MYQFPIVLDPGEWTVIVAGENGYTYSMKAIMTTYAYLEVAALEDFN